MTLGHAATISIFIVEGRYGESSSILGIHFTGDRYAFVFKDIVESIGGTSATQRYIEQSVVVHEVGHAIGLVNNGVPMHVDHEDPSHSGHTSNSDGVMYWAVESADSILNTVADFIVASDLQLFGAESLADGRNFKP